MDDLANGEALSIPQVKSIRPLPRMKRLEGQDMSLGDVHDVNVIPYACPIGSFIIGSINRNLAPLLQEGPQHRGDEVAFRIMILAYEAIGICTSGIEIPQGNVLQAVGNPTALEDFLEDELRFPIRIYREKRRIFLDWNSRRIPVDGG